MSHEARASARRAMAKGISDYFAVLDRVDDETLERAYDLARDVRDYEQQRADYVRVVILGHYLGSDRRRQAARHRMSIAGEEAAMRMARFSLVEALVKAGSDELVELLPPV